MNGAKSVTKPALEKCPLWEILFNAGENLYVLQWDPTKNKATKGAQNSMNALAFTSKLRRQIKFH